MMALSTGPGPNLFIIGAAKAGTTTLHQTLSEHPDIFMSDLKEPAFFVPELQYHPKSEAWYLSLFEGGRDRAYRGESSTHYAKIPLFEGVPERVHAFAPDARLIYLVRDPIDRALSHYWHNTRSRRPEFKEDRPMLEAIEGDPLYRSYSDYTMQLEPWFELFGKDAVAVMVFEEMVEDPVKALEPVLLDLGLRPFGDELELPQANAKPEHVEQVKGLGILDRIRRSETWNLASPLVPQRVKDFAKERATGRAPSPFEDRSQEATELLLPWARGVVRETEELLGRPLPAWRTSRG